MPKATGECAVCGSLTNLCCPLCKRIYYCCEEHKQQQLHFLKCLRYAEFRKTKNIPATRFPGLDVMFHASADLFMELRDHRYAISCCSVTQHDARPLFKDLPEVEKLVKGSLAANSIYTAAFVADLYCQDGSLETDAVAASVMFITRLQSLQYAPNVDLPRSYDDFRKALGMPLGNARMVVMLVAFGEVNSYERSQGHPEYIFDHALCIVKWQGCAETTPLFAIFQSYAPYYDLHHYLSASFPGMVPPVTGNESTRLHQRLRYHGTSAPIGHPIMNVSTMGEFVDETLGVIAKATVWTEAVRNAHQRLTGVQCQRLIDAPIGPKGREGVVFTFSSRIVDEFAVY